MANAMKPVDIVGLFSILDIVIWKIFEIWQKLGYIHYDTFHLAIIFHSVYATLGFRAPEKNNSTSFLPVGPSPAFHPPAHISICAGGWALVTNPQSAPYCGIIYFRDPYPSVLGISTYGQSNNWALLRIVFASPPVV